MLLSCCKYHGYSRERKSEAKLMLFELARLDGKKLRISSKRKRLPVFNYTACHKERICVCSTGVML
jgi:hypothetical protein